MSALAVCVMVCGYAVAKPAAQVDIHDPAMIRAGDTYFLYSTGPGITFYSSKDRVHWVRRGRVFASGPAWARGVAQGFNGHIWAPDILQRDGLYYLYYSVSGFGKNDSAIGLAVNRTLDPDAAGYKWEDRGIVLRSVAGRDDWNAIDPNIVVDDTGAAWMAFGSFWSGIKLVKLNKDWTAPAEPQVWHAIARRDRPAFGDPAAAGPGAIEGPFLFRRDGYYYLFVSTGLCCRGRNSTYRIAYGRSKTLSGPYLDKQGHDMAKGGGTMLLPENTQWAGWGGQGVYAFADGDYVVFHAYENADNDFHRLKIEKIVWKDGWPGVDPKAIDRFRGWLVK